MTAGAPVGTVRPMVDLPRRARALVERAGDIPPPVVDAALALVVGIVTAISIGVTDRNDASEGATWWGWALVAAQVVPLAGRRRHPVVVAVATGVATFAYGMANLPDPAIYFPLTLAFYSVAAYRPRRVWLPVAASFVVSLAVGIAVDRQVDPADVAVNYTVGLTAWVVGDVVRTQRERAAWMAARREEEARRAVAEERVRLARDLHDVVAHHVSVIAVQAEAAQEVLATHPERAEEAMATVAATARTALDELRHLLGVLRSSADRGPQPELSAIDHLVDSVRSAGVEVDVRTAGRARPVRGVVGVTAYRVVQEALTNVLRHSGGTRACVDLAFDEEALEVRVTDDGHGESPGGSGGHGLAGMRERVALVGGALDAGPGPAGGFVVRARLPFRTP